MKDTQETKSRLLAEKQRVMNMSERIEGTGLAQRPSDSVGELSLYDNHPSDMGAETYERGKDIGLWDNLEQLKARIDIALEKLERGNYGSCEHCGKAIDERRLQALPWAVLCYDCQKEQERLSDDGPRPVEEDILSTPFSRTFLDDTSYTGFDGEDSWQAVARYGSASGPQDVGGVDSYDDTYIDSNEQRGVVEDVEEVVLEDPREPFGKAKPRPDKKTPLN